MVPTATESAETARPTITDVPMARRIGRSWKTPIWGRVSPKNQFQVKPSQGRDGNWLSLKAKTATTTSGSASHAKKSAT